MLNVSVDVKSDCIDVSWEWVGSDAGPPEPPGYLIKWGAKEEQVKADVRTFNIPVDDETALLVTLQTMGEHTLEYETLVKLRCVNIDKQKEEALILIMRRKAELMRDIARIRRDVEENAKEISFFEDPVGHENARQASKQKELKQAVRKFNQHPKKGLEQFILMNVVEDTPKAITTFLLDQKGLSKVAIGELMGEPAQKYLDIVEGIVMAINFTDMDLVEALRIFLSKFRLPGEAQKIDRIIETFSKGYTNCNPDVFSSPDACYVIAFSIILLNTSLHNPNVREKPTEERFVRMSSGIDQGKDLPHSLIAGYYRSIRNNPFKLPEEEDQAFVNALYNPDREGFLYKLGGRMRGWKRRWMVLTEKTLYYFDDAKDREPKGIIPLNNVQVRMCQDRSRSFCFELYRETEVPMLTIKQVKINPDGQVVDGNLGNKCPMIRFSAPTQQERDEWVGTIKRCLGRDPMYDFIADRRRRAGSIRAATVK